MAGPPTWPRQCARKVAWSRSSVSMRTKADSRVPFGLSRWSSMGSSPVASKAMSAATTVAASSSSSRPVTSRIRRSNSFSCNQAESRRRPGGSSGISPCALMPLAYTTRAAAGGARAAPRWRVGACRIMRRSCRACRLRRCERSNDGWSGGVGGRAGPSVGQGALHALSLRPRARVLDPLGPEELPVVFRHRLAGHRRRALAGKPDAGQHDGAGDRAARAGLERGLLRPAADRPPDLRAERLHVRLAETSLSPSAVTLSRAPAGDPRVDGLSTRLRSARLGAPDGGRPHRAVRDLLAHGPRRKYQLGLRARQQAPDVDAAPGVPGPRDGLLSARHLSADTSPAAPADRLAVALHADPEGLSDRFRRIGVYSGRRGKPWQL